MTGAPQNGGPGPLSVIQRLIIPWLLQSPPSLSWFSS